MPEKPPIPKAAEPKYGRSFDPWNSVALGHQRAETRGPNGWRENRTWKLHSQFRAGNTGGGRINDAVGPSAEQDAATAKETPPPPSVLDMLRNPGSSKQPSSTVHKIQSPPPARPDDTTEAKPSAAPTRKIFDGLVIYVNGSTHPLVSDHRLKHLLAENGARTAIHLGRRQVTHVILGKPAGGLAGAGAGGGLAGGKLEREIRRVGGCGVKYVGVEWVLESLKAGVRLPEARFASLSVASKGQKSVLGAFSRPRDGEARTSPG